MTSLQSEWEKEFIKLLVEYNEKKVLVFIERVRDEAVSNREKEIAEEVKKMKYTHEQIKDIGLAWQGHPCVGANDALDKVLSILKHNQ